LTSLLTAPTPDLDQITTPEDTAAVDETEETVGNRRPPEPRVVVTCGECGTEFSVKPSRLAKGKGRWCSTTCFQTNRSRRLAPARERKEQEKRQRREQRERERQAAKEQRARESQAAKERRAQEHREKKRSAPERGHTPPRDKPKLRTERPATKDDLVRPPRFDVAAVELVRFIETFRSKTGESIEQLGARVEKLSTYATAPESGTRSIRRIIGGETVAVGLDRADEIALATGTTLAQTNLTALALTVKAARHATLIRAEIDEEKISDAALERRAEALLHFSQGFLAGIQGTELEPTVTQEVAA
jgi:hypothetical protein